MLEMSFKVDDDRTESLRQAYDTLVEMAKNVGFITTKVVNDELKPDLVSRDLLISDKNWWSYKEFKEGVVQLDSTDPVICPGSLILRFPQYHTGPYPTTGIVDGGKRMSFGEGLAERESPLMEKGVMILSLLSAFVVWPSGTSLVRRNMRIGIGRKECPSPDISMRQKGILTSTLWG